jgi:hypothetical protein
MEKSERFGLVLSPTEKHVLQLLAELERIPKAAVIRRLILREAESLGAYRSRITKKSLVNGGEYE